MTAVADEEREIEDLLPEHLRKGAAVPLQRTKKQQAALERAAAAKQAEDDLAAQQTAAKAKAAQLAQVVNLAIGGYSFEEIGASIGATASDVERMLVNDTARFVRTQPALRMWVRNYISGKYTALLDAVWDEATDKTHGEKLEHQDRALRILDRLAKLHGAEAPTQSEVKVDAAPEAVDRLVQRLAASQGMGYDADIFDTVPGEVVHEAAQQAATRELVSGNRVGEDQPGDEPL